MSRTFHALVILLATMLVAACAGSPASPAPSSAPSAAVAGTAAKPDFDLTLDGTVELPTYTSDKAAALNFCSQATSGGWSYSYGGGDPFVTLNVSIYSLVTDGSNPSDFDFEVVAPDTRTVRLVASGRKEGVQGVGTATVSTTDDGGTLIQIDGSGVTLQGGPRSKGDTEVHLTLRCPG